MRAGDVVRCQGEAQTRFIIQQIDGLSAFLRKEDGPVHGWESLSKLTLVRCPACCPQGQQCELPAGHVDENGDPSEHENECADGDRWYGWPNKGEEQVGE